MAVRRPRLPSTTAFVVSFQRTPKALGLGLSCPAGGSCGRVACSCAHTHVAAAPGAETGRARAIVWDNHVGPHQKLCGENGPLEVEVHPAVKRSSGAAVHLVASPEFGWPDLVCSRPSITQWPLLQWHVPVLPEAPTAHRHGSCGVLTLKLCPATLATATAPLTRLLRECCRRELLLTRSAFSHTAVQCVHTPRYPPLCVPPCPGTTWESTFNLAPEHTAGWGLLQARGDALHGTAHLKEPSSQL